MILGAESGDGGLYVCHVTSQVLDRSVLSTPIHLEVLGQFYIHALLHAYSPTLYRQAVAIIT